MKLKFVKPYSLYHLSFHFRKQRNLQELEAILLTSIHYSKDNKSLEITKYLEQTLNLSPTKWSEFVYSILNNMNGNEISFPNDISFQNLLVGDIVIDKQIQNYIDKDKFYGMQPKDEVKQEEFLVDLQNTNYIFKKNNIPIINVSNLSKELIAVYEKNKEENKNKCIEEMLKDKSDAILKDVEDINDQDDYFKNIVFSNFQNEFECSKIDFENNNIEIPNKSFYEFIEKMVQFNTLNIVLRYFEKDINKNSELFPHIGTTRVEKPILDINDYKDIIKTVTKNNELLNQNKNIGIYQHEICVFDSKEEIFKINNDDLLKFKMKKIYYSVLNDREYFNELINQTINSINWLNWLKATNNETQKSIIKQYIFDNYIELSQSQDYKEFIINNFDHIEDIKLEWIFSSLINMEEFKKLTKINNTKIIEMLNSSKIDSLTNSDNNGVNKINYLYSECDYSIENLNKNIKEVKEELELINEINKLKDTNDLKLINDAIKLSDQLVFNENKDKYSPLLKTQYDEIVKNNKKLIIEELEILYLNKIRGKIDKFFRQLSGNDDPKSTLHDNLIIIEKKQKLDKNIIEKFHWIKRERNKFSHKEKEEIEKELFKFKLNELQEYLDKWKEVIAIMERITNESFN
ncbi:hypothetical protein ACJA29_03515 [Metamycoplasma sualvi]|uniref:hypothetical protein n=1 Tax=Metamycoplasma sualvi TaxID=2125 RepID=UPI0038735446